MKHINREHDQEANHMANLGAEEVSKVIVETVKNTETWKAIRGFWYGSTKEKREEMEHRD